MFVIYLLYPYVNSNISQATGIKGINMSGTIYSTSEAGIDYSATAGPVTPMYPSDKKTFNRTIDAARKAAMRKLARHGRGTVTVLKGKITERGGVKVYDLERIGYVSFNDYLMFYYHTYDGTYHLNNDGSLGEKFNYPVRFNKVYDYFN